MTPARPAAPGHLARVDASPSLAERVRLQRSVLMEAELESAALRLFVDRGFSEVTVDDIARSASTSVRTFYRYFGAKEDVLQVNLRRRAEQLRAALDEQPADEPPLASLRRAVGTRASEEEEVRLRQWISAVIGAPSALLGVVGGAQLANNSVLVPFFTARLAVEPGDPSATVLAAASAAAVQTAVEHWYAHGGELHETLSAYVDVLARHLG